MFNAFTHNGTITVKSRKTGEHRTVRIKTQPTDSAFFPGERIVELLVGPDNTADYSSFGVLRQDRVILWKKHRETPLYQWLARFIQTPELFQEQAEVMFESRCRRCNRKLTHPTSIESGIGPECAGRVQ